MKWLSPVILCCLTVSSYSQQTTSVPIIVGAGDRSSISIKASDLKVEVNHQPVVVTSITPLAGEHLQYVLLNDQSGRTRWPGGIKQQADLADQFLKQVVVTGSDLGSLVNFGDSVYIDVQNEKDPRNLPQSWGELQWAEPRCTMPWFRRRGGSLRKLWAPVKER